MTIKAEKIRPLIDAVKAFTNHQGCNNGTESPSSIEAFNAHANKGIMLYRLMEAALKEVEDGDL